jgi:hypothetical protein
MSETNVRRRGFGEDGIYLDAARNRYMGAISLGFGPDGKRIRRKVSAKTKQEVRAKLQALHQELNAGVKSSSTYTVREAVDDWLREGLDGTSERTRTLYEGLLGPVLDAIGARPLRVLSAGDVRSALSQLATRYSTRSLQITRNSLERAIRHAESNDLVGRNVAALVKAPQGRSGRRSKSFTLDQAKALLAASEGTRLHAYIVLSLLVGIRTEEARALHWDHVVIWVDDPAGWQPVSSAGFDPSRAAKAGSRSTSGARSVKAATPRPRNPGGPWRCRGVAWRRCASSRNSRSETGSWSASCGRSPAWSSRPGLARR